MTMIERLKRSCLCAVVVVTASAVGVLVLGFAANQSSGREFDSSTLLINVVGSPLIPGWLLFRELFESVNLLSLGQIATPALLVVFTSVAINTGIVFVFWELGGRIIARRLGSNRTFPSS